MRRFQTRQIWSCVLVLLVSGISVGQQTDAELEDSSEQQTTDALVPPRVIEFEVKKDPVDVQLFRADPKLLEQRFAAIIVLGRQAEIRRNYEFPEEIAESMFLGPSSLFGPRHNRRQGRSMEQQFRKMIENLPKDRRLSEKKTDFLVSNVESNVRLTAPRNNHHWTFTVFAPTESLAKERARTLLHVLDYGVVLPIQRYFQRNVAAINKSNAEKQQRTDALKSELNSMREAYDHLPDISGEDLSRMKTEHRLLTVDMAGTQAKIRAAAKILEELSAKDKAARHIEQVENIKITAEIEFAGLSAKKGAMDVILANGIERDDLKKKMDAKHNEILRMQPDYRMLQDYHSQMKMYAPHVLDRGKILVQPIRWKEAVGR